MADGSLPHRIAVLCYLRDEQGFLLLLHRRQQPNLGMYSPIGGKLETSEGEGPHDCAVREIREETGITIDASELRLLGIVSERAYQDEAHWVIFLFEVTRPIRRAELKWMDFEEGTLEWKRPQDVAGLPIPRTDRDVMWPLVQSHRGGFFMVHIDWSETDLSWTVHESVGGERGEGAKGRRGAGQEKA